MADAVILLGAGSSADFGVPTLNEIFDDDDVQEYLEDDPRFAARLREVFWEPRGHTLDTAGESINVEEMLTILRDWENADAVSDPPAPLNVSAFRKRLYVLIERAVHRDKNSRGRHLNPLLSYCRENFDLTTWGSFNWDCIFEATYWWTSGTPSPIGRQRTSPRVAIPIERWQGGRSREGTRRGHELLKLHGSVSWWLIPPDEAGGSYEIRSYQFGTEVREKFDDYDAEDDPDEVPAILEPSFHKYDTDLYDLLEAQWDRLLLRLVEADLVVVVGYSLPPGDSRARATLLTAFQVNEEAPWLVVNPGEEAQRRYRRLFGDERLTLYPETLEEFNDHLEESLDEVLPDGVEENGEALPF